MRTPISCRCRDACRTRCTSCPSDLPTPQISIYNPSEAVVVSLAASSATLSLGQLSAIVTNDVVPAIEQVPGVSYVQENGNVTASIQVNVNPQKISVLRIHADRRHQCDREQQRARAGRHRL